MTDGRVVLDAPAVLAFVLDERVGETVRRLLPVGTIPAPDRTEVRWECR